MSSKRGQNDISYLQKQPGNDHIGDPNSKDVAALEFFDERHGTPDIGSQLYLTYMLKNGPIQAVFLVLVGDMDVQQQYGCREFAVSSMSALGH